MHLAHRDVKENNCDNECEAVTLHQTHISAQEMITTVISILLLAWDTRAHKSSNHTACI